MRSHEARTEQQKQQLAGDVRDRTIHLRSHSMKGPALQALALLIGFYLMAMVAALGLILTPVVMFYYGFASCFFVAIPCFMGAGTILWSIAPRPDHFTPPGPRLTPETQPRLFAAISEVAQVIGEKMPDDVYLFPGVNAFVRQRGGFMGFRSRRVMGVGLALTQVLTISEFKAIIAHEFGHYYGGDLKLGPWIYKTRESISRTINGLSRRRSALSMTFLMYGMFFMEVTQAISRRQEFVADEIGAHISGTQAFINGLRALYGGDKFFQSYWRSEVRPRVNAGYRPPIVEGFSYFVGRADASGSIAQNVDDQIKESKTDIYDSHPSLAERIAAIEQLPAGEERFLPGSDARAISLLDKPEEVERQLLEWIWGKTKSRTLKAITWEPIGKEVSLPDYEELVRQHSHVLKGLTPLDLSRVTSNLEGFCRKLVPRGADLAENDMPYAYRLAQKTLGAALVQALLRAGWEVHVPVRTGIVQPNIYCERNGEKIEPFVVVHQLGWGKLSGQEWKRQCQDAGIAEMDLGSA